MSEYEEYMKNFVEAPKKDQDEKYCKQCFELKTRQLDGMFDAHNKRWRDPVSGLLWNGRICPQCHQKNTKKHQREKRKNVS